MKVLYYAVYLVVRALSSTLRVRHVHPEHMEGTPQYILAFWHRHMLPLLGRSRWKPPIAVMTSRSKDGDISTNVLALYGVESARGSSTRGGSSALRGLLRKARDGRSMVFTPDGPRGPAGVVKDGVIFAAQASRLPILPMAYAAKKFIQLRSWDRMIIPKPFSKGLILYGAPIVVPRDGDTEEWRVIVEQRLNELSAEAERLVNET
ncbi:MAG TPA: lysophospholipid acyltransferase family protein [Thermoanaerobaculia bacterium]